MIENDGKTQIKENSKDGKQWKTQVKERQRWKMIKNDGKLRSQRMMENDLQSASVVPHLQLAAGHHKECLQKKITKSAWKFQMSSSKICHWQNETLHETVIIWNCTSMSSFKPLPLQLESGFRPLPVPQSLPCSPFFTTKWSALDWGGKVKDELQENKGTTRSKTRKKGARQGGKQEQEQSLQCSRLFSLPGDLRLTGEENSKMNGKWNCFYKEYEKGERKRTNQKRRTRNKGNVGRRRRKITKMKRWKSNHEKMRKLLRKVIFWFLD